jgi:autonomous glycyl radical cofactor GrcA
MTPPPVEDWRRLSCREVAVAVTEQDIATVSELTEAKAREVMAEIQRTKRLPGTHHRVAEMVVECDALLDAWLALGNE